MTSKSEFQLGYERAVEAALLSAKARTIENARARVVEAAKAWFSASTVDRNFSRTAALNNAVAELERLEAGARP